MKKPRFNTPYTYNYEDYVEAGGGEELAVPDQSYDIPELFERFASGLPLEPYQRNVTYDEDGDEEPNNWDVDPSTVPGVDIVDIDNAKKSVRDKIEELQSKLNSEESVTK